MYFDPHCGHCKKMQPELEELASAAFDDGKLFPRGNLGMLQLDVTSNDPNDSEWQMPSGVPVLHLYPALCSSQAAKQGRCPPRSASDFSAYSGGPEKASIVRFIEKHAKHSPIWTVKKSGAANDGEL